MTTATTSPGSIDPLDVKYRPPRSVTAPAIDPERGSVVVEVLFTSAATAEAACERIRSYVNSEGCRVELSEVARLLARESYQSAVIHYSSPPIPDWALPPHFAEC